MNLICGLLWAAGVFVTALLVMLGITNIATWISRQMEDEPTKKDSRHQ